MSGSTGFVTVQATHVGLVPAILTRLPLSLLMLEMLRFAAAIRTTSVILMGSLAVSAITSTALSMFHPLDATAMILGWNLGTAVLFLAGAALLSRNMSKAGAGKEDRTSR